MNVPPPYKSNYDEDGWDSIALPLDASLFDAFPVTVDWNGKIFQKKDEFHITLIHAQPHDESKLALFFTRFIENNPVGLISFKDDFRHAVRGDEETILMRCLVSNIETLFQKILDETSIDLPVQPTHVTLYMFKSKTGISIDSEYEMQRLSQIYIPTLDKAFEQVGLD
ncbi:MAG: hypothetical protein Q7S75_01395 [bacterium]|nr:hypothetical protein [bacterium]